MKSKVKGYWRQLKIPGLDWIQVEVSSNCNAQCLYCPRTVYKKDWHSRHLAFATYEKLLPIMAKTKYIHLQGWGEPLLNPDFFKMVSLAKQVGSRVGTTSNGVILNEEKIIRLVESGVDILGLSLAGVDEKNDQIRKGTDLEKILQVIDSVNEVKSRLKSDIPAIHIAYMLLKSDLDKLEKLPALIKDKAINELVISTLDLVCDQELSHEAIQASSEAEMLELQSRLDQVVEKGKTFNLNVHYQFPYSHKQQVCSENVQKAFILSANGDVIPCVLYNLSVPSKDFNGKLNKNPYQRLSFGNINEESIETIWRKKSYKAFRNSFYALETSDFCSHCPKLHLIIN